ncbi:MAG: energy-coupling factor transporter transmembrane protein EcfT [Candidatus Coatesbacteria bacterium]|nr:energy-coupling factor transporter transmembrane protein EcfT [Candidatus Coatesbacteria bacterium]
MAKKRYGLYSRRRTIFHGLHPLSKLLCAFMILVSPLFLSDISGSLSYLALCLVLVALGRAWSSLRALLPIISMMAFVTIVVWPLFWRGGEDVFGLWGISITDEGLLRGLSMASRLISLILVGIVFLTVTRVEEFMAALRLLGLPFVFTFTLMLSFRLAPTFIATVGTIRDAQKARGHTIDQGNPLRKAIKHVPLIIPVILHAIRGTDVLSMALESRGFGKKVNRTSIIQLTHTWRDPIAYSMSVMILSAAIFWRYALL